MNEIKPLQIATVILHVADPVTLDRCRDWYRGLGLEAAAPDEPGESYWFEVGRGVGLGVHYGEGDSFASGGATIYLEVPSADDAYERLKAGGFEFQGEPEDKFWGRVAYLTDPAGNRVGLLTPSS